MRAISPKNVRQVLAVAAGLGLMLTVGASAAQASSSSQSFSTGIVTLQPGTQAAAFAECPTGTVVTGGGFLNIDAFDSATDVAIAASWSVSNGWQVVAFNPTNTPQTVHARATCAPTTTQTRVAVASLQPGTQGTAFAACPTGTVVTGGGFLNIDAFDSATDVAIAASRPVDNGWQVIAFNATDTPQAVHARATCAVI